MDETAFLQSLVSVVKDDVNEILLKACSIGNVESVKELLSKGANPKYERLVHGSWGQCSKASALNNAIGSKNTELITLLINSGANPNARTQEYNWKGTGSTQTEFQSAFPLLLTNPSLLSLFLSKGADPNETIMQESRTMRYDGIMRETVLHVAIREGSSHAVVALLNAGAKVDEERTEQGSSEYGTGEDTVETALHIACYLKDRNKALEMTKILLEYGANVNKVRKFLENERLDNPPSYISDPFNFRAPVRLVPKKETPLHIALIKKDVKLVWLLVSARADTTIKYEHHGPRSTFDLCNNINNGINGNNDSFLKAALVQKWSPDMFHFYPSSLQNAIISTLIIAKRGDWKLDLPTINHILSFVVHKFNQCY